MNKRPTPNPVPRPPGELEELERVWRQPTGIRILSAVNNTYIGLFYLGAALLFLLLGGVLALLMRTQLAVPDNTLIEPGLYNQLFTMHGSVMMFLFAVPVVEALAILLLPAMLGARDLPFPRLSAYAFWAYFVGGLGFYASLFAGLAPDGGWFMYPPLTSYEYSPGIRTDFWLLGIGFIEISAIAGAIEIVVGILRTRPPGMSLGRMPIYVWAMLVTGMMIVMAFPAVILATALLELERAFHWPFFIANLGGDPVLWQHLFWLFGHPDVYIIFLPAAGIVSMLVATIAQVPVVGYRWLVSALVATGVISFALWVHHMFAIGMPHHAASFFSGASMAIAIPAGIQIFSWLATLRRGRIRWTTPAWFVLAFFATFVLGGLTGVMVAVVPYDWQVHDTYFVVAHLHYVLLGGMMLPVLGAIYYWAPLVSGRPIPGPLGKISCAVIFLGINLAFMPMHIVGLLGMPRRVWTYAAGLGWEPWNLLATVGAFVLAAGVLIACFDFIKHIRVAGPVDTNPWNAGTMEWLPMDNYAIRSIPAVTSREPLWDNPELRAEVAAGAHYLPGTVTGTRETIVTSAGAAIPQYLLRLPGPGWLPLLAGLGTAAFFFALTLKLTAVAVISAAATLVWIGWWLWDTDPPTSGRHYAIGGGIELPDGPATSSSHGSLGTNVLLVVDGIVFACLVFSFFYLRSGWDPDAVDPAGDALLYPAAAAWLAGWLVLQWVGRRLDANAGKVAVGVGVTIAALLMIGALLIHWQVLDDSSASPDTHAHPALLYTLFAYQVLHGLVLLLAAVFTLARLMAGRLTGVNRAAFDVFYRIWSYSAVQAVVVTALTLWPPG